MILFYRYTNPTVTNGQMHPCQPVIMEVGVLFLCNKHTHTKCSITDQMVMIALIIYLVSSIYIFKIIVLNIGVHCLR